MDTKLVSRKHHVKPIGLLASAGACGGGASLRIHRSFFVSSSSTTRARVRYLLDDKRSKRRVAGSVFRLLPLSAPSRPEAYLHTGEHHPTPAHLDEWQPRYYFCPPCWEYP